MGRRCHVIPSWWCLEGPNMASRSLPSTCVFRCPIRHSDAPSTQPSPSRVAGGPRRVSQETGDRRLTWRGAPQQRCAGRQACLDLGSISALRLLDIDTRSLGHTIPCIFLDEGGGQHATAPNPVSQPQREMGSERSITHAPIQRTIGMYVGDCTSR